MNELLVRINDKTLFSPFDDRKQRQGYIFLSICLRAMEGPSSSSSSRKRKREQSRRMGFGGGITSNYAKIRLQMPWHKKSNTEANTTIAHEPPQPTISQLSEEASENMWGTETSWDTFPNICSFEPSHEVEVDSTSAGYLPDSSKADHHPIHCPPPLTPIVAQTETPKVEAPSEKAIPKKRRKEIFVDSWNRLLPRIEDAYLNYVQSTGNGKLHPKPHQVQRPCTCKVPKTMDRQITCFGFPGKWCCFFS